MPAQRVLAGRRGRGAALGGAGLVGNDLSRDGAFAKIPLFRRGDPPVARRASGRADGARTVRYTNPASGGAVMSTLDCYAVRLSGKTPRGRRRSTSNAICLVVSGAGRSTIGEHSFDWSRHDVFTVPHWSWASHRALDGEADLFVVSDKVAFERLDLCARNCNRLVR